MLNHFLSIKRYQLRPHNPPYKSIYVVEIGKRKSPNISDCTRHLPPPPKSNLFPKNGPFQKKCRLPTTIFKGT